MGERRALEILRCYELASWSVGAAQPKIERYQRQVQRFGQGDVPSVVAGQIGAQFPYTLSERREWVQFHLKLEEASVCVRRFGYRNFAGYDETP